jgi:anti-sigma-K factor RskA
MNYGRPELLDRLAAEYALGSMTARVRRRFLRLRRTLPAAERAAQIWERRLAALSVSVPAVDPPSRVWQAIEHRTRSKTTSRKSSGWMSWLAPAMAFAFGVISADAIIAQRDTVPASYVGLLTDGEGLPTVLASSTRHGTRMSIKFLRPFTPPAGMSMQLWALPKEGAPFRLGTIPPGDRSSFTLVDTSEHLLSAVTRLAVSLEAASADAPPSPSPFVLTGHCVKLW